jgi:hypothetical protein
MSNATELLLELLEHVEYDPGGAIRKRVRAFIAAEPEAEPVAWQVHPFDYGIGHKGVYAMTQRPDQVKSWERKGWTVEPLHLHPPRPELEPLNAAILPNGSTATNVYEAYEEGLKEGSRRNGS